MQSELGPYLHTFTILGRCDSTGQLGIGIATYSLAVGAYCPVLKPGLGVIASQAYAKASLGILAMQLLEQGNAPERIFKEIAEQDQYFSYRQIGIVDGNGLAECHTGTETRPWAGHILGDGHAAMGNSLAGEHVVEAISRAFSEAANESLDERLLRGLEAGRDAGGQQNAEGKHLTERSAALVVHGQDEVPLFDLRVDAHMTAVEELRRIHGMVAPYIEYIKLRSEDPPNTPSQDVWAKEHGLVWEE